MKRTLLALLIFAFLYTFFLGMSFANADSDTPSNEGRIEIVTGNPSVLEPIYTKVSGIDESDIKYEWYVDGVMENEASSSFSPKADNFESFIEVRIIGKSDDSLIDSDSIYFSKLPVIYINTDDGEEVVERKTYIGASMVIQGNASYSKQYDGRIEITARGGSSWGYPKKPYKIKLEEKTDLFGFGKSKHFVLLANYVDPSLLRNTVAYGIAGELGLTTTDSTWVDVILNGEYVGNYQLVEHVRIGEQLVDIEDIEEIADDVSKAICKKNKDVFKNGRDALKDAMTEDLSWLTSGIFTYDTVTYDISDYYSLSSSYTGGYLLEIGNNASDKVSYFTSNGGIDVSVSKPEYLSSNPTLFDYVKGKYQDLEDALKSEDGYNSKGEHYSELADMDSMVSYWLVNEIMSNEDSENRSRYMYLNDDGIFVYGPVWDFDISSMSYRSFFGITGWNATRNIASYFVGQDIFGDMVNDPLFQSLAIEKYWYIRPYLEYLIEDNGLLSTYRDYLYESAIRNESIWTCGNYIKRTFSGKYGDYEILKNYFKKRIEWMDKRFSSKESLRKSLDFVFSSDEYRTSSKVSITSSLEPSSCIGADYSMGQSESFELNIATPSGYSVRVYLNGILYETYESDSDTHKISVSSDLPCSIGNRNVFSVIAKRGNKTIKNDIVISSSSDKTIEIEKEGDCLHSLLPLSSSDYYYCPTCDHYYLDSNASDIIDPSVVFPPSAKGRRITGYINYTRLIIGFFISIPVSIILVPTIIIIKIRSRKNRKSA